MAIFTDIETHVATLRGTVGADAEASALPHIVSRLTDHQVISLLTETAALIRAAQAVQVVASGVAAARSTRDAGHSGLAQVRGQGSVTSLLQDLTGITRSDALKQVRAGESLIEGLTGTGADGGGGGDGPGGDGGASCDAVQARTPRPWHAPLGEALLHGRISGDQHDAIRRGLGEPPTVEITAPEGAPTETSAATVALLTASRDEARRAWECAATQLIDEAACRTVEDLASQARAIRDLLDPEGAQRRFDERYERRSFRTWKDRDGISHGSFQFDDEGALWIKTILDTALAPRRGVRFVDEAEKQRAQVLTDDPRTNDQLAYDLAIDLLRTGALADAATVFGTRQAGVRIIVTQAAADAADRGEPATASAQDDTATLPAWLASQHACETGVRECRFDHAGNPLDLGREARLFSAKQKLSLAIRDGGCRWPGCDRPAHYCEAHHIDPWAGGGSTDIDRGILLCRFHHGQLHHGGWRITRHGRGDFTLHPPGAQPPVTLTTRLARRYLFASAAPPPPRFRPAA